jgi:hypothetical protein
LHFSTELATGKVGKAPQKKAPQNLSRCQLEPQLHCRDDGDIFPSIEIVEDDPAAVTFEVDRLAILPPGDIVPPLRIGETPLAAIIEMNETIPHETEMPAFESLSVHANTLGNF